MVSSKNLIQLYSKRLSNTNCPGSLSIKKVTATLFIDLSEAFDTVKHEILIEKKCQMNFLIDAILLITSFLEECRQFVESKYIKSNTSLVMCGVPQGSQIAPPLYLIFINDIFKMNFKGNIQLYADDIAITYSCDVIVELQDCIRNDLNSLSEYIL